MKRHEAIRILSGQNRSPLAAGLRGALSLAEPLYRAAIIRRNRRYDHGARPAKPLGRPTLSVGNLTTGGTGKTPMVIDLVRRLQEQGHRPAVLLRGYKAKAGPSDETAELRAALPGVKIVANPSRAEGAREALGRADVVGGLSETTLENQDSKIENPISCFVLDDGFQHRQAARDLDLVLIDATCPWGFGHLLPRGLLREPQAHLARADAVLITRADQVEPDALTAIDREVEQLTGRPPLAHTAHRWAELRHGDHTLPLEHLITRRVVAVSAIGNPAAFERTLRQHCREVLAHHRFDDHHAYTAAELADLLTQAKRADADAVITTEKDYVKWKPLLAADETAIPILRPRVGIEYLDGQAEVAARLAWLLRREEPIE
jgi:tetraacyldisaccharide 4'-kinase